MTVDQPRFHRMVKNKCALCSSQRKKAVSATPVQASSDLIHALTLLPLLSSSHVCGVRPEQVELVKREFFITALQDGKESFTVRDEADIFRFGIEESPSISRASWPPESGSISRHRELPA